jgi:hypothetical protein
LDPDYADGISLWQHEAIKNYQRLHSDMDHGVDGWLHANNEISHLIDESLKLKRTRTHKRIARYRETAEQVVPKAEKVEAATLRTKAPTSAMADHASPVGVQDQTGTSLRESAVLVTRPHFKAEIGEIHQDQ